MGGTFRLADVARVVGINPYEDESSLEARAWLIWKSARRGVKRSDAERGRDNASGFRYVGSFHGIVTSLWPEYAGWDEDRRKHFTGPIYEYLRATQNAQCLAPSARPPVWWVRSEWNSQPVVRMPVYAKAPTPTRAEVKLTPSEAGENRDPEPVTVDTLDERIVAALSGYREPLVAQELARLLDVDPVYVYRARERLVGRVFTRKETRQERSMRAGGAVVGQRAALLFSCVNPVPERTTRELVPGVVLESAYDEKIRPKWEIDARLARIDERVLDAIVEHDTHDVQRLARATRYTLATCAASLDRLRSVGVLDADDESAPVPVAEYGADSPHPELTRRHYARATEENARRVLDELRRRSRATTYASLEERLRINSQAMSFALRRLEVEGLVEIDRSNGRRYLVRAARQRDDAVPESPPRERALLPTRGAGNAPLQRLILSELERAGGRAVRRDVVRAALERRVGSDGGVTRAAQELERRGVITIDRRPARRQAFALTGVGAATDEAKESPSWLERYAQEIRAALAEGEARVWTRGEIREATGLNDGSVSYGVRLLEELGEVRVDRSDRMRHLVYPAAVDPDATAPRPVRTDLTRRGLTERERRVLEYVGGAGRPVGLVDLERDLPLARNTAREVVRVLERLGHLTCRGGRGRLKEITLAGAKRDVVALEPLPETEPRPSARRDPDLDPDAAVTALEGYLERRRTGRTRRAANPEDASLASENARLREQLARLTELTQRVLDDRDDDEE